MPAAPSNRSRPIGLLLILAVALALYGLLLAGALNDPGGGGESRMSAAFEELFLSFALWLVLTLALIVAGITGAMPRWARILAVVLVPTAAVAFLTALDMVSPERPWPLATVALLPLLIGFYALWARLPALHAAFGAERTSTAVWAAVFFLSVATFVMAA